MSFDSSRRPLQPAPSSPRPHLLFSADAWRKMMTYVALCPVEINGFGYVDKISDGLFVVDDVIILDQFATAGSVDVSAEVIAGHITSMLDNGDNPGRMRLQWHSHVEMEAYFSITDTNNIDRYDSEWMFSLVVNKFGEFEARLDLYRPFRVHIPVDVSVDLPSNEALTSELRQEIGAKVHTTPRFRSKRMKLDEVGQTLPGTDATAITVGEVTHAR